MRVAGIDTSSFAIDIVTIPIDGLAAGVIAWHCFVLEGADAFDRSRFVPNSSSRPGTTRRLLRISSVSVRMKKAPSSSIHFVAGSPTGTPTAARNARMKSA